MSFPNRGAARKAATPAAAPTGWSFAFNFRGSEAYGAPLEQDDEVFSTGTTAPTLYDNGTNTTTAGRIPAGGASWNRESTVDRRLRGAYYQTTGATPRYWHIDVPAAGTYRTLVACGDPGSSGVVWADMHIELTDQLGGNLFESPVFSINTSFPEQSWAGVDGVLKNTAAMAAELDALNVYHDQIVPAGGTPQVVFRTVATGFHGMSHIRVIQL